MAMKWRENPIQNLDEEIVPFWDGLKRHEFLLCRCKRCGASYWPAAYCRNHKDIPKPEEMEWAPTSGKGSVFAWTRTQQVTNPDYADDVPYVMALIELDEGPIFGTRIINCDPYEVQVGMRVEVMYDDAPNGYTLPFFQPSKG